ncbi:lipoxygenase 1 [Metarhizium album ARSEF 1941]|uniref:Manganese lipoxygenase n=1 Tax=Metarhizium album (strain ARSEF 1941) TaxID=1081103 RepID=A0A0B2WKQ0_METAS|nr:lipoxygenase 1 [Metarhizium album ARSEF 1941]KHN94062.1 lipoxygenase 1 [Metarhizium album ARSEF 1941]
MAVLSCITDRLQQILTGDNTHDVEQATMEVWDKGVFLNELQRQGLAFTTDRDGNVSGNLVATRGLKQGTYKGTRLALTELYNLIQEFACSQFDTLGFEPIIPQRRSLEKKREKYQWSNPADGYPPHLSEVPQDQTEQDPNVGHIFDQKELGSVSKLAMAASFIIPKDMRKEDGPFFGPTLAAVESHNRSHPSPSTDIMDGKNIGFLTDWFSDARFAQQHFSGVNPTTIATAPHAKVKEYVVEAERQGLEDVAMLLEAGKDLLIQDYSYFREATGVGDRETFENIILDEHKDASKAKASRYGCASVIIFQLHDDGRLHPLAITIDYKGSLDKSVTLFNQRLHPDDRGLVPEAEDWPWRYAKTCAQSSDWARHEIAVHLVDTHLVEEVIIVATNRTVPEDHLLYELLSPHWFRTLALNKAARAVLVPLVVARISGFGPSTAYDSPATNRCFKFIQHAFRNFNFVDKYIPNDLKKRGFDMEGNTTYKYRNYPYATDMFLLWHIIRDFVQTVLGTKYKTCADVRHDRYIADWCVEIQTKGQLASFPTITTVDELVDAVTMCIHIASPQHTAVNYLQDYYYSFVPSKPPALCRPLPTSLEQLTGYTETELTEALPIGTEDPKWKDWLLAAQLPELLSFKVDQRYNLLTYAKSLYNVNKDRTERENERPDHEVMKEAAAKFYSQLKNCEFLFKMVSELQTPGAIEYKVLQPEYSAVSILI